MKRNTKNGNKMKKTIWIICSAILLLYGCGNKDKKQSSRQVLTDDNPGYDVCVYGGSSAGVIAAYAAKMLGKSVILISPDKHLGGLTSGGLGATDIGNKYAVTGISRNFYRRIGKYYDKPESWTFEPHVAEEVFNKYIKEAGVEVLFEYRLKSLSKQNTEIQNIVVEQCSNPSKETNKTIAAKMFIDATYVGDLMAKAGVSYTVGRESNAKYNETINGVQMRDKHQFPPNKKEEYHIDPYVIPGDSTSGLCYGISNEPLAPQGTGDKKVQAYNYRLCLTQDSTNKIGFTKPEDYDSTRYELLRRVIAKRDQKGWEQKLGWFYLRIVKMPKGKTDVNNKGPMSTDFIGMNYEYPEANYEKRKQIEKAHENYIRGLLYFLSHDTRLPLSIRNEMDSWGWAKDEFTDNNYFPYKMYIREARRMVGEYVMTEHHCRGDSTVSNPIGLAAYTMDSHNCQRVVIEKDGKKMVKNEGDVQVGGFPPYPISYRSLTPKRSECTNLLVPVCLSASHIAYGSIRMEPVFMVTGQVCGMAASMAIEQETKVQTIDIEKLQKKLTNDPLLNGTPADVVVDNEDSTHIKTKGNWKLHTGWMKQYKTNCLVNDNDATEQRRMVFQMPVKASGKYKAYLYIPGKPRNADKNWKWSEQTPVKLHFGNQTDTVIINQNENTRDWAILGEYELNADEENTIEIIADTISMPVVADAAILIYQK